MPVVIRKAIEEDESALTRICLLTADAGKSAVLLHDYPELPGLVYAVPYIKLPTTWGFVLEDQITNAVVGYVLGSKDTRAYEAHAEEHWWPALAEKYPPSIATKPGDVFYTNLLRNMYKIAQANIDFSPAHLHIDILPEYQKQGWGSKLIAKAIEHLKEEGLEGIWVGLDPRNAGAGSFYGKLGFKQIEGSQNAFQLGLKFVDFRG